MTDDRSIAKQKDRMNGQYDSMTVDFLKNSPAYLRAHVRVKLLLILLSLLSYCPERCFLCYGTALSMLWSSLF